MSRRHWQPTANTLADADADHFGRVVTVEAALAMNRTAV
jgi:hypothetical protein